MSSLSETMIIGLTGGIASGKSTVVEMIKEAGYKVIDADQLVHDMQAQGGRLYRALLDWLGEEILLPNISSILLHLDKLLLDLLILQSIKTFF